MRKLFALGLFDDVWLERARRTATTSTCVIHVGERPRIAHDRRSPATRSARTSELEKKLIAAAPATRHADDRCRPRSTRCSSTTARRATRSATVEAAADTTAAGSAGRAALRDRRGREGARSPTIQLRAASARSRRGKLRKQLKTKQKGFFGGGEVKEEKLARGPREARGLLPQPRLPRRARRPAHELTPGKTPARPRRWSSRSSEGPLYRDRRRCAGRATPWSRTGRAAAAVAAAARASSTTASRIEQRAGRRLRRVRRARLPVRQHRAAARRCATRPSTSRSRSPRASRRTCGWCNITGNQRHARERDPPRARRSTRATCSAARRWCAPQGDVFRLGFFEDVQIDFAPADSTDVDIILKVKEKQVGTASAGAGYTGETGLTGFLELGAQQRARQRPEPVSSTSSAAAGAATTTLSFTEPWFRDTPTLLGFSVFNTERERDLYDEKRIGGSVRIGRPLPWPDYSRGSVALPARERHDRRHARRDARRQDSLVLRASARASRRSPAASSSTFSRNSTEQSVLPDARARGSTSTTSSRAGRSAASVNFHKHRLEAPRVPAVDHPRRAPPCCAARFGVLGDVRRPERAGAAVRALPPRRRHHHRSAARLRRLPGGAREVQSRDDRRAP